MNGWGGPEPVGFLVIPSRIDPPLAVMDAAMRVLPVYANPDGVLSLRPYREPEPTLGEAAVAALKGQWQANLDRMAAEVDHTHKTRASRDLCALGLCDRDTIVQAAADFTPDPEEP